MAGTPQQRGPNGGRFVRRRPGRVPQPPRTVPGAGWRRVGRALVSPAVVVALAGACATAEGSGASYAAPPRPDSTAPGSAPGRGPAATALTETDTSSPLGTVPSPDTEAPAGTVSTASASPAPTTTPAATRHAVGTFWQTFTDPARGRAVPTLVHYPARGRPGEKGTVPADGAFPLVAMAHGYRLPAAGYERILTALTEAGYITIAPAFPGTSAESGNADRADIVHQPGDLSFVIDQVVALGSTPGGPLPPVLHPGRVGLIGHSDGGLTASAVAYNSRYRDERVAAVVVMTGGRALFPGAYFDGQGMPPVLAVHGTNDGNPYSGSVGLVRDATAYGVPAYLLTVEGGGHIEPYMFDTALPALAAAITGFLDAHLRGQPDGVRRMRAAVSSEATLRLEPA